MMEIIYFFKDGELFDRCPARWYSNPAVLRARMELQGIDLFIIGVGEWEEEKRLDQSNRQPGAKVRRV